MVQGHFTNSYHFSRFGLTALIYRAEKISESWPTTVRSLTYILHKHCLRVKHTTDPGALTARNATTPHLHSHILHIPIYENRCGVCVFFSSMLWLPHTNFTPTPITNNNEIIFFSPTSIHCLRNVETVYCSNPDNHLLRS